MLQPLSNKSFEVLIIRQISLEILEKLQTFQSAIYSRAFRLAPAHDLIRFGKLSSFTLHEKSFAFLQSENQLVLLLCIRENKINAKLFITLTQIRREKTRRSSNPEGSNLITFFSSSSSTSFSFLVLMRMNCYC